MVLALYLVFAFRLVKWRFEAQRLSAMQTLPQEPLLRLSDSRGSGGAFIPETCL